MDRNRLPVKPGLLHRSRLDNMLRQGLENYLVTVVAGPGYGKTQAVAVFAKQARQKLVWLSLSELDNDPEHFWSIALDAVRQELPKLGELLDRWGFKSAAEGFQSGALHSVHEIRENEAMLLVVDNYNCIHNAQVKSFLDTILKLEIDGFSGIVISNAKADLNLGKRLKGSNHSIIVAADLCFNKEETTDFLRFYGVHLSDYEQDRLLERTEGWPLPIYLSGVESQSQNSLGLNSANHFSYVAELFEDQYFDPYGEETQNILVLFSFLPCFSIEMVRRFVHRELKEIEEFLSMNDFIYYDYGRKVFTFHKMYLAFLKQKEYRIQQAEKNKAFSVAGDWLLDNQMILESIFCFWNCERYDDMMNAIQNTPTTRKDYSWSCYVLEYLEKLPEEYVQKNIRVDFSKGYMNLNNRNLTNADRIFTSVVQRLESIPERTEEEEWVLGETYTVLTDVSVLRNNEKYAEYIRKACQHLKGSSKVRSKELMMVGNNEIFFLPGNQPGQLEKSINTFFEAIPYAEKILNYQGYGIEWLFAAEGAYCAGNMKQAREYSFRAIYKASEKDQHDIVCNAHYLLARIGLFQGSYQEMSQHIAEIPVYLQSKNAQLDELVEFTQSWFYIVLDETNKVAPWVAEYDSNRHIHNAIEVGRNQLIYAGYLSQQQRHGEAAAFLAHMEQIFEQKGLWITKLRHRILKATCLVSLERETEALDELWIAYDMAWQNNMNTAFIEYDTRLLKLLDLAKESDLYSFSEEWLDVVYQKTQRHNVVLGEILKEHQKAKRSKPRTSVSLTKREMEVLEHLATGMTREEIGNELHISVNSVKRHITGIYNKLGAVNRADAIRIATIRGDLKMLEE